MDDGRRHSHVACNRGGRGVARGGEGGEMSASARALYNSVLCDGGGGGGGRAAAQ